jgi:predicted nucleotide-binding protein
MSKPSALIFSSVPGLKVAKELQNGLRHDCHAELWNQGMFEPSDNTLGSLITAIQSKDFAIIVMTPDDRTIIGNQRSKADVQSLDADKLPSPRDNTVFELGLSIGILGRERTFLVRNKDPLLKIPTDLNGYNTLDFEFPPLDVDLRSATAYACNQIAKVMQKEGFRVILPVREIANIRDKNLRSFGASIVNSASAAVESLIHNEAARMDEEKYLEYLIQEIHDLAEDDVLFAICGGKNYSLTQVYKYLNENIRLAIEKKVAVHRLYVAPFDDFIDREWEVIDAHVEWANKVPNFKVGVLIGESECAKLLELKLPHRFGMVLTKHKGLWKSRIHYGLDQNQQGGWEFRQEAIILKQIRLFEDLAQLAERIGIPQSLQQRMDREIEKLGSQTEARLWRYGQERPLL